jgi:hypothetical protein
MLFLTMVCLTVASPRGTDLEGVGHRDVEAEHAAIGAAVEGYAQGLEVDSMITGTMLEKDITN